MKNILLLFFALVLGGWLGAQDNLSMYGTIKSEETKKKLVGAKVTVLQNGSKFDEFITSGNGEYELELPLGFKYRIKFEAEGHMQKVLEYDTSNIPEEDQSGGFRSDAKIELLASIPGFDEAILNEPIGKYSYDPIYDDLNFDPDYTAERQDILAEEKKRLEKQADKDEKLRKKFDELVRDAEQGVVDKEYEEAIANFDEALALFDEAPVREKKAEAQRLLQQLKDAEADEAKYLALIEQGDKDMKSGNLEAAKNNFEGARDMRPNERVPKEKLDELSVLLAAGAKQKEYDDAVASANGKMDSQDYAAAIGLYEKAAAILPAEKYPKDQIKKAQAALDALAAAEETQAKYDAAMAKGEEQIAAENYPAAKAQFEAARDQMPDVQLPKDKIKEVEDLIAGASKQAQYDALISEANGKFDGAEYQAAIDKYEEAKNLIPAESYPQKQIDKAKSELKKLAEDAAALEEMERKYNEFVAQGNENMSSENYEAARSNFESAKSLKPDESLPKEKLAEIASLLDGAATQKAYDEALAKADGLFDSGDFAESIGQYESASTLKPSEAYPKERIKKAQAELDKLASDADAAAELERKYKEAMDKGASAQKDEQYEVALADYKTAKSLKPDEQKPQDKIAELEQILDELRKAQESDAAAASEQAKIDAAYQAKVDEGNALFTANNLEEAKSTFEEALVIKPIEVYPKNKINRINELLREQEELAADEEARKRQEEADNLANDAAAKLAAEKEAARLAAEELERQRKEADAARMAELDDAKRAQEEADRLAREEKLRKAEEERLRKERLAEEKRKKDQQENDRVLSSNVDLDAEKSVERWYRQSKEAELAQRDSLVNEKKENHEAFLSGKTSQEDDRIANRKEGVAEQNDRVAQIAQKGENYTEDSVRDTEESKAEFNQQRTEYNRMADVRRENGADGVLRDKQRLEDIALEDKVREGKIEQNNDTKARANQQNETQVKMGDARRADNKYKVEEQKEVRDNQVYAGETIREENIDRVADQISKSQNDIRRGYEKADDRSAIARDDIDDKKERYEDMVDGGELKREERIANNERIKRLNDEQKTDRASEAKMRSEEKRTEKFDLDDGKSADYEDYTLPEGAEDLAEGVTQTSYRMMDGQMQVIERTVRIGNKVDVYKKVISKNSTFYFKNERSITEVNWIQNTILETD